ncbi:MAG: nitrous oxide reductase accessory protein NosL [Azoarcus sp.]|jgi:nitrous oxide reductase accessory protein NosL|nr:nitrous oxide reductase accessory protein NosL [Azoarcus sp.]
MKNPPSSMLVLSRRRFLVHAAALPLLTGLLTACGKSAWPEGMAAIHWDRDACSHCKMAISDHRFAVELRGGPASAVFKFDDIGCFVSWLQQHAADQPWAKEADARLWVANFASPNRDDVRWLAPRRAYYVKRSSPMGYDFAAVESTGEEAVDFEAMQRLALTKTMKGM